MWAYLALISSMDIHKIPVFDRSSKMMHFYPKASMQTLKLELAYHINIKHVSINMNTCVIYYHIT